MRVLLRSYGVGALVRMAWEMVWGGIERLRPRRAGVWFFLRKEFGGESGVFTSGTCSILVLLYDLFLWMLFLFFRGGGVGKRRPGLLPRLVSLSISCYNFSLFVV